MKKLFNAYAHPDGDISLYLIPGTNFANDVLELNPKQTDALIAQLTALRGRKAA